MLFLNTENTFISNSMMRTSFIILLFTLICSITFANRFKHLSTHNGLSNKRTFSIVKDNKGFMWISTRAGIDRYDGKNVKQYMLFDENGKQDLTGRINILKKDKSGNLWAYTNYGQVFEYNIKSDSYVLRLNLLDYLPEKEAPFLIEIGRAHV